MEMPMLLKSACIFNAITAILLLYGFKGSDTMPFLNTSSRDVADHFTVGGKC